MTTAPDKNHLTANSYVSEMFSNVTVKQSISSYDSPKKSDQEYPQGSFSLSNTPKRHETENLTSAIRS